METKQDKMKAIEQLLENAYKIEEELTSEIRKIRKAPYMGCGHDLNDLESLRSEEERMIIFLRTELLFK